MRCARGVDWGGRTTPTAEGSLGAWFTISFRFLLCGLTADLEQSLSRGLGARPVIYACMIGGQK